MCITKSVFYQNAIARLPYLESVGSKRRSANPLCHVHNSGSMSKQGFPSGSWNPICLDSKLGEAIRLGILISVLLS